MLTECTLQKKCNLLVDQNSEQPEIVIPKILTITKFELVFFIILTAQTTKRGNYMYVLRVIEQETVKTD